MKYIRIGFHYKAEEDIEFPANPANTFRGALGYRLIRLACIQRNKHDGNCHSCLIAKNCAYALCFETGQSHINEHISTKSKDFPHLMIIDSGVSPSSYIKHGDSFTFYIQLFGKAVMIFPHIVLACSDIGKIGLTKSRKKSVLVSVTDEISNQEIWNDTSTNILMPTANELHVAEPQISHVNTTKIELEFITPIAFKDRKSGGITTKPEFNRIIGSLMRRYSVFQASEKQAVKWNFSKISKLAQQVKLVESSLKPIRWERFSTKQKRRIPIAGVIGKATYEGPIEPFIELLNAAKILRAGRSTTFGQGKIYFNSK